MRQIHAPSPLAVVLTDDLIDSVVLGPALAQSYAERSRTAAEVIATLGDWEHWGHIPLTRLSELYRSQAAHPCSWIDGSPLTVAWRCPELTTGAPSDVSDGEAAAVRVLLTRSAAYADAANVGERPFDLMVGGTYPRRSGRRGRRRARRAAGEWQRFVAGGSETPAGMPYVNRGLGTSSVSCRTWPAAWAWVRTANVRTVVLGL